MKYIELICYKQVLLWQEENVESLSSLLPVKSLIKEHGHEVQIPVEYNIARSYRCLFLH